MSHVQTQIEHGVGRITLDRARALNALSLDMIRELTAVLLAWQQRDEVQVVTVRGMGREGPFGAFCAGGDIRFFHEAAHAHDTRLEDFFTEEYALNHLIHHYPKPYLAFMDGVVMGGGMGISQGARCRIVTERTRMAMPETLIGLFPDVGGGFFLSRCSGHVGEYLALTGQSLQGVDAVQLGLADVLVPSAELPALWAQVATLDWRHAPDALRSLCSPYQAASQQARDASLSWRDARIDAVFGLPELRDMVAALERQGDAWASATLHTLRQRSPLLLHVTLEQIRRARQMNLAQDLRMERDLVRHCFHPLHLGRNGAQTDTVEGIRALAVDKDHTPRWHPARIEDVTPQMVAPFFHSPWPAHAHPLRDLQG